MKSIELYQWWRCGKLDGDGYETDYQVSDEDYNTIVELVKKYAEENCEEEDKYIDPQDFTDEYFYENARSLYDKIDKETTEMLISTTIETAEDWFDEEAEGCTIKEYLKNNYDFGFYFTKGFLASIVQIRVKIDRQLGGCLFLHKDYPP